MMKFLGLISLVLFCVLIAQAVDGGKHHHKRAKGNVRSDGGRQIVPAKVMRKIEGTAQANLEFVQADNEAAAKESQENGTMKAEGEEKQEGHAVHTEHRKGHKKHGALHFRRKDEGKHNHAHHKHGFHKRNHSNRPRHHNDVKIDKENLRREILALNSNMTKEQLKRLIKVIKRGKHIRRNRQQKPTEEHKNH